MIEKFLDFELINEEDIPRIPLYIDQVTGFLDEIFEDFKVEDTEKTLTKTMINNYVKAGVIESPEKKKYNKTQIIELMMIYMLKNTTQIQEIEKVLKQEDSLRLFESFKAHHKTVVASLKETEDEQPLEKIFKLLISASLQKRYAEMLIKEL